eukprot:3686373-Rhodomonas_salina.1
MHCTSSWATRQAQRKYQLIQQGSVITGIKDLPVHFFRDLGPPGFQVILLSGLKLQVDTPARIISESKIETLKD